jgi:hypothetical protein
MPSPVKMRLAVLEPLLRLVVMDCSPVIDQSAYCSLVIDMTANASDIFVGVMLSELFWFPALVAHHYHAECLSPILRFSSARLASHKNYRILPVTVIEYSSEDNLDYQKEYLQLLVAAYSNASCLDYLVNSKKIIHN